MGTIMSFFPNKFFLNILACGLILSCPCNLISAANNGNANKGVQEKSNDPKVNKTQTQLQWKNYKYAESGFSVDFPKKPERVQQSIDVPKSDLKISYETYLSEPSDAMVFVASVWNYPSQIDMSKPEVNLQDGFGGMLSALPGSEVLNMRMTEVEGFKALEFLVKNDDIYFQGKLILVHNTLYQLFTVYKNSEDMTANYIHFVDSFKLINPEKRKVAPSKNGNGKANGIKNGASSKMNV
jgi:uncharacterized protein YxeA